MKIDPNVWTGILGLAVPLIGIWGTREYFLSDRIAEIDHLVQECQERYSNERIKVIEVSYELRSRLDKQEVIEGYIDSLPFAAWIKRQDDDGQFRMVMINRAYEDVFDVRKEQYEGKTDFEMWDDNLAAQYRENDLMVMRTRGYLKSVEQVVINNEVKNVEVWKFSVKLAKNRYGVGGIIRSRE